MHGNSTFLNGVAELLVYKRIVKTDVLRLRFRIPEINSRDVCPINGSKTHRAWFAGGEEYTVSQYMGA